MKNTENIFTNCQNTKNDIAAHKCHLYLPRELFWLKKSAYLYKDLAKT